MAVTITEQLTKLNQLRQQLAANLTTKGVTATATEKFNTLVPKVLAISGGESPTTTVLYDATHRDKVSALQRYDLQRGRLYRPACRFLQCEEQLRSELWNNRFWMGFAGIHLLHAADQRDSIHANCNPFPCWQYRGWHFTLSTI